jgi:hypothetical protein
MFLEAITTSVGYDDFLAEAVPFNRPHLDRWLIVTTPGDTATRELCRLRGLEVLLTGDFHKGGADFDKARAIDHALSLLTWRDWVIHLDADVVLPGTFRASLDVADLDPACVYGCDRFSVRGWERWHRLKASGFLDRYARCAHHAVCFPENFPVGARWADDHQGYVPIGFLQLFHASAVLHKGIRQRRYAPHGHNDAARTDVQFALRWDRRHRQLLPEVVVAHLESDERGAPVGANWRGRRTRRFGPGDAPGAGRPPDHRAGRPAGHTY